MPDPSRLTLAAILLLAGCTTFRAVDHDATVAPGQTFFVMGVNSDHYRVKVFPGHVSNGIFHEDVLGMSAVFGAPTDGYLVGKAAPGDVLAITMVRHVNDTSDFLGQDFIPCLNARTMVFTVPDKHVVYLGDIDYQFDSTGLRVAYADKLDTAAAWLASHYPKLGDAPQHVDYELLPTALGCSHTIYVPVYVRR
jgi:hypothetical protein